MTYRYRYQQAQATQGHGRQGGGSFVRNEDSRDQMIRQLQDLLARGNGRAANGAADPIQQILQILQGQGPIDQGTGEAMPLAPVRTPGPAAPRGAVTPQAEVPSAAARGAVTPQAEVPPRGAVTPQVQIPNGATIVGHTADGKTVVRQANGSIGLLNPDGSVSAVSPTPPATGGTGATAPTPPPPAAPSPPAPSLAGTPGFSAPVNDVAPGIPAPTSPTGSPVGSDAPVTPQNASGWNVSPAPSPASDPFVPAGVDAPVTPTNAVGWNVSPAPDPVTPYAPPAPDAPITADNSIGWNFLPPTMPSAPVNDVAPTDTGALPPPPDFSTAISGLGAMPDPGASVVPDQYAYQLPPMIDEFNNATIV